MRFCRIAIAENSIDQYLTFVDLLVTNQRGPQQICNSLIIWMLHFLRVENANDIFILPHSQVAIAKDQSRLVICRILGVDPCKFRRGVGDSSHLVVRQREIEPRVWQTRRLPQGGLVLGNGLLEASQARQRRTQVRMDSGRLGMHLEELPVFGDRTSQVACLLLLHRVLNELLRALGVRRDHAA